MTTPTLPPIAFVRGDTVVITGQVTLPNGSHDITGFSSLTFLADCANPQCKLVQSTTDGSVVVATPTTGEYVLTILPAVTNDALPDQAADIILRGRWKLLDSIGNESTIERRTVVVSQS
jgi:hypothetical protein